MPHFWDLGVLDSHEGRSNGVPHCALLGAGNDRHGWPASTGSATHRDRVNRFAQVLGPILVALAAVRPACAASVHVSYLVECPDFLLASFHLQRMLTLELYAVRTCDGPPLVQQYVTVEAIPAPDRRRGPPVLALETDIDLDASPPELFLRLTGYGVKPIGDACQLQTTHDIQLALRCPPDSVSSGGHCVDKYEASLWEIPAPRVDLICKVIDGTATLKDLTVAGVRQVGHPGLPFGHVAIPGSFRAEGGYATPLYAASVPGVLPSTDLSAYQAWAACGFSSKRLPTTGEWTTAATGTPEHPTDDSGDCNTGAGTVSAGGPVKTGSRSRCVSSVGAFDMVGNVSEWTMDGHSRTGYRGGAWDAGDRYGISFTQPDVPLTQDNAVGFRCVR